MTKNLTKLAELLGAKIVGQVPDVGGGAFGAARLVEVVGGLSRGTAGIRVEPHLPPRDSHQNTPANTTRPSPNQATASRAEQIAPPDPETRPDRDPGDEHPDPIG